MDAKESLLPDKLITRSKASSSEGYRTIVNYLENLSKDETGAPVKWRFNKKGVQLAKGIDKKIIHVGHSEEKSRQAHHSSITTSKLSPKTQKFAALGKNTSSPTESNVTDNNGASKAAVAMVSRKVRRLKTKPRVPIMASHEEVEESSQKGPQTVKSWSSLQKSVFMKKERLDFPSATESVCSGGIDSEVESIDSSFSGTSDAPRRRHKRSHMEGIQLGPKKSLRSQDSATVRNDKRKRTLSGEFELLDEIALKRQVKMIKREETEEEFDDSQTFKEESLSSSVLETVKHSTEPSLLPSPIIRRRGRPPKHQPAAPMGDIPTTPLKEPLKEVRRNVGRRRKITKYSCLQLIGPGGVIFRKKRIDLPPADSPDLYAKQFECGCGSDGKLTVLKSKPDPDCEDDMDTVNTLNSREDEGEELCVSVDDVALASRNTTVSDEGGFQDGPSALTLQDGVTHCHGDRDNKMVEVTSTSTVGKNGEEEVLTLRLSEDEEIPANEANSQTHDSHTWTATEKQTLAPRVDSSESDGLSDNTQEVAESAPHARVPLVVSDDQVHSSVTSAGDVNVGPAVEKVQEECSPEKDVEMPSIPGPTGAASVKSEETDASQPGLGSDPHQKETPFGETEKVNQSKAGSEFGEQNITNNMEVIIPVSEQEPSDCIVIKTREVTNFESEEKTEASGETQTENLSDETKDAHNTRTDNWETQITNDGDDDNDDKVGSKGKEGETLVIPHDNAELTEDADSTKDGSLLDKSTSSSESSPESDKKSRKREFQLRQKASRSPLEIIAMKQSMEERQYILEMAQKAQKREEKQKKIMDNKLKKNVNEPPGSSPFFYVEKTMTDEAVPVINDELVPKPANMQSGEVDSRCKPCSVLLIDFVKYLKMSAPNTTPIRDSTEEYTDQSDREEGKKSVDTLITKFATSSEAYQSNINENVAHQSVTEVSAKIVKKKRRPSARKQAHTLTYSAQLTAEIVSNPIFLGDGSGTTVPPLRLKIKQNIITTEPLNKKVKVVKKQHKARKGMSPFKGPKQVIHEWKQQERETKSNFLNLGTAGFEGSVIEFIQSKETAAVSNDVGTETKASDPEGVKYRCAYRTCKFTSSSKEIMESHVYIHMKNTPFRCFHCGHVFTSRDMAFLHMRTVHPHIEAKMEALENVDEKTLYREVTTTFSKSAAKDLAREDSEPGTDKEEDQRPQDSNIIKVVVPETVGDSSGCYCCGYCEFSTSDHQEILNHVHSLHHKNIQYTCSLCGKQISGFKDVMTKHFTQEHPNQPVMYKCLPEFYDLQKGENFGPSSSDSSVNKPGDKIHAKSKTYQKTSAEADSTTQEVEDPLPVKEKVDEKAEAKTSQSKKSTQRVGGTDESKVAEGLTAGTEAPMEVDEQTSEDNESGLKIVQVVSLQGLDLGHPVYGGHEGEEDMNQAVSEALPPPGGAGAPVFPQLLTIPQHSPNMAAKPSKAKPSQENRGKDQKASLKPTGPLSTATNAAGDVKFATTYKCEKCSVHAPVLSSMVEHLRVSHKDISKLFLCPYCRKYEGATEPEIHMHIKQVHGTSNQKSPPVALSTAAKKHLRTIQVPVSADARKVGEKYVVEKDIYKCLKCHKHMPSLDYIYDHLEKTHNEVFVYICPYCKTFKNKKEDVVFNHIKNDHQKSADDIMLSLAIEENLFTRIQTLVKDKGVKKVSQKPGQAPSAGKMVPNSQEPTDMATSASSPMTASDPVNKMPPHSLQLQQTKSALRKSRPHHILPNAATSDAPKTDVNAFPHIAQALTTKIAGMAPPVAHRQTSPQMSMCPPQMSRLTPPQMSRLTPPQMSRLTPPINRPMMAARQTPPAHMPVNSPPPLIRAPPPPYQVSPEPDESPSPKDLQMFQQFNLTNQSATRPANNLPVLRVPTLANYGRSGSSSSPSTSQPQRAPHSAPLDLSKSLEEEAEDMEEDDLPPESFQIFNIRPQNPQVSLNVRPPNLPVRGMSSPPLQAMQQMAAASSRMPHHPPRAPMRGRPRMKLPSQRMGGPMFPTSSVNPMGMPFMYRGMPYGMQPQFRTAEQRFRFTNGKLKCPYCNLVLDYTQIKAHITSSHSGRPVPND